MVRFGAVLVVVLSSHLARAADHEPDPGSVRRYDAGYRYEQAGWTVLHVEGDPYPRGYQHGRLMAGEIAKYAYTLARERNPKDPAEGWATVRLLTDALFLRKLDREFLEEMKGIADGAADGGATFGDRKLDLLDVAAVNVWQELDTLEFALRATPTGLEGVKFAPPKGVKKDHCSAFAATGPATADGKVVFGHITMFGLHFGPYVNVWIDVKPTKGRRFAMQGFPGAVWSSQDYYQNDAGILLCETTIDQTPFDPDGEPLTTRARRAIQYATSIDDVVRTLSTRNNGLYANEWLIADTKTNEIAMFELGTRTSALWRSSKNQWFGDTPGFYWGCNNVKDLAVRLEARPASGEVTGKLGWRPDGRDAAWVKFYGKYKGRIDADAAKAAFADDALALPHSLDAKFTTTALAKDLSSWCLYGPPTGRVWRPTADDRANHPGIRALEPHPWTVLTTRPPPAGAGAEPKADPPAAKRPAVPTPWVLPAAPAPRGGGRP
jgi:hypothetical protein